MQVASCKWERGSRWKVVICFSGGSILGPRNQGQWEVLLKMGGGGGEKRGKRKWGWEERRKIREKRSIGWLWGQGVPLPSDSGGKLLNAARRTVTWWGHCCHGGCRERVIWVSLLVGAVEVSRAGLVMTHVAIPHMNVTVFPFLQTPSIIRINHFWTSCIFRVL